MSKSIPRWIRSFVDPSSRESEADALEKKLTSLEREVERAPAGYRGTSLNRAGDLCFKSGWKTRALEYYGRAIDTFLEDQQLESARGVGVKIVRLHPDAVRTLCTLTWLDLAARHRADAVTHLRKYVAAVLRGGKKSVARTQIRKMALAVGDPKIREAAAEGLERLGDPEAAAEVRVWIESGWDEAVPGRVDELRARCFEAAVRSGQA